MSRIVLMNTALVLNVVGFANFAAVLPALRASTGFNESQSGLAGGIFFLAYALGSPVFSALTDVRNPKTLYLLGGAFSIVGGLLFPLIDPSFASLMLARLLSGIGMAGTYSPGLRLLMESLPKDQQQRGAGLYVSTMTLGLSVSFALSGTLELAFGWPSAFLGASLCTALALLLVGVRMPAPALAPTAGSLFRRLQQVARLPRVAPVLGAAAGNTWEGMAYRTWWVAMLGFAASRPAMPDWSHINFALATAFTGLLAMPISAWVAQRAENGPRLRVLGRAAASSVIVAATLIALLLVDAPFWLFFAVSVVYMCAVFSDAGALASAMLDCVPPADRGAALALYSACANLSAFASIVVCGLVLQIAGGAYNQSAWLLTIAVMTSGSLLASVIMHRQHRTMAAVARRSD